MVILYPGTWLIGWRNGRAVMIPPAEAAALIASLPAVPQSAPGSVSENYGGV